MSAEILLGGRLGNYGFVNAKFIKQKLNRFIIPKKNIKLLAVFLVILLIVVIVSLYNFPTKQSTFDSIFPSKTEIPEGWSFKESYVDKLSVDGFAEGKTVTYGMWNPNNKNDVDVIFADLTIYKFSNSDTAKTYYDKQVSPFKSDIKNFPSLFREINIPNCFAYMKVEMVQKIAQSFCLKDDIFIKVYVFNANDFGNPEESLNLFTGLLMK